MTQTISDKLSIGFVLFNPSEIFFKRLSILYDLDIEIYIYDNSPKPSMLNNSIGKNVHIISAKGNLGLGRGLNSLGQYAYSRKKDALLYFDQDTLFDLNSINYINEVFIKDESHFKKLASIFFTNKARKSQKRYVIMPHHSGMLFNLENLKLVGWHNKNIFLDVLD